MTKKTDPNAVSLSVPVKIDGKEVSVITLRKPSVGELRGLKLTDILQMDVTAMLNFLPRISQPPLTSQQVAALEPSDFMDMAGKAVLFFVKKEQMAALENL